MRKVVINKCHGGFGLSSEAQEYLMRNGLFPEYQDFTRDNPILVACVEELGDLASGRYARLAIIEIPSDVNWEVKEYDGFEHIAEVHRIWE